MLGFEKSLKESLDEEEITKSQNMSQEKAMERWTLHASLDSKQKPTNKLKSIMCQCYPRGINVKAAGTAVIWVATLIGIAEEERHGKSCLDRLWKNSFLSHTQKCLKQLKGRNLRIIWEGKFEATLKMWVRWQVEVNVRF